jgi:chromosome partitioning protein
MIWRGRWFAVPLDASHEQIFTDANIQYTNSSGGCGWRGLVGRAGQTWRRYDSFNRWNIFSDLCIIERMKGRIHGRAPLQPPCRFGSLVQVDSFIVRLMAIIAITGRKGGIGKSTIAGNLAAEFEAMGRTVVLLDADPQHSLAAWAAQGDGMLSRCVQVVDGDGLRDAARKAEKEVDIVLIDTPPGMPQTAHDAAMVADLVLLPCGPSPLDLFALKDALSLTLKVRAQRRNKKPRVRFVASKVLMHTNLGRGLSSSLEKMGKKVLPPIGQRIVVAEAVSKGLTVAEFAPSSAAREEFQALAKAVYKIANR